MSAKHESWGQGGPEATYDRETTMTCTNGLERSFTLPQRAARPSLAALLALSLAAAVVGCTRAAGAADEPFITASCAAMEQMMKAMAIQPSGGVDRDFLALMIPHHGSAIATAQAALLYG